MEKSATESEIVVNLNLDRLVVLRVSHEVDSSSVMQMKPELKVERSRWAAEDEDKGEIAFMLGPVIAKRTFSSLQFTKHHFVMSFVH